MSTLSDFLELYPVINTKRGYKAGVMAFLDFIYGPQRIGRQATPEEWSRYEDLAEQYREEERDRINDLMRFNASNATIPPLTAKTRNNAVKEFYAHIGFEMSPRDQKRVRLRLPKGSARTIEQDLDHQTLRAILQHMDIKSRAFFLTLVSSGMRVGELVKLSIKDFSFKDSPGVITIRGEYTKTGESRFTFVSDEAVDALKEWMKVREKYMIAAANRNRGLVRRELAKERVKTDPRMFPFSQKNAGEMWTTALKNADHLSYDPVTGRSQIHIHMLRKFFRSQLGLGCPVDIVEALMGHSGYLTDAYRRFTKKQMGEYYKKAEHLVTLTMPEDLENLRQEQSEQKEVLTALAGENRQLRADLLIMSDELRTIKKLMAVVTEKDVK